MTTKQPPATPAEMVVQVRAEMARQRITLPQLADRLGVPYPTLYGRFANADRRLLYRDLAQIAEALGVPLATLEARAEGRAA